MHYMQEHEHNIGILKKMSIVVVILLFRLITLN